MPKWVNPLISGMGEHKANMLGLPGYGAAARISGECDDAGATERIEAIAFDAQSSQRTRQLSKITGAMPLARRNAARATGDARTCNAVEGLVELAQAVKRK